VKITLVTETFPPEVNGVAMTLSRLVNGLAARGHELTVVRPRQKNEPQEKAHGYGEKVVMGLPIPGYPGLRFGLPNRLSLLRYIDREKPDIIHVATEGPLGVMAINLARKRGIPISSSFHTNFHSYSEHYGSAIFLKLVLGYLRWVHNRTGVTFAPSPDVVQLLSKDGFKNVDLLGRGVDTQLFNPGRRDESLRKEWGAQADTPVAIYVGRVASEKNLPLSVEAVERMRKVLPGLKFVIVGDGPIRKKLQEKHPDFHFAGMRHGEDLARHYASADSFPFASTSETFGNVVTEAMASGLVVSAYAYAAPGKYIRHGENGFLAPYDEREAFLSACEEMANRRADWPTLAKAAVETVAPLSWDRIIDHFEAVLQKLAQV